MAESNTDKPAKGSEGKAHSTTVIWWGANLPSGYTDITEEVDRRGLELWNADTAKGSAAVLFEGNAPSSANISSTSQTSTSKGKAKEETSSDDQSASVDWVESDTDEQLMLYIPFQSTLKLHTIQITSIPPQKSDDDDDDDELPLRPKTIKLYTNRTQNLGFEEAEDTPATQVITLEAGDWDPKTNTARLELRFVKFQNIVSLVMFVVDGDGEGEKVRIDRLRLIGESGMKREVQKLEKITHE